MNKECPICLCGITGGEKLIVLGCHEKHYFHKDCYNQLKEQCERSRQKVYCPYCRAEVIKTTETEADKAAYDDPFAVGNEIGIELENQL